jgi:hypothetical protein
LAAEILESHERMGSSPLEKKTPHMLILVQDLHMVAILLPHKFQLCRLGTGI